MGASVNPGQEIPYVVGTVFVFDENAVWHMKELARNVRERTIKNMQLKSFRLERKGTQQERIGTYYNSAAGFLHKIR